MVTVFALAWTGLLIGAAGRFRPRGRRMDADDRERVRAVVTWPERLGRRATPRRWRLSPMRYTQIGLAVVGGFTGLLLWVPLGLVLALGGWAWPLRLLRRRTRARRQAVLRDLPDVVDLFGLAFAADLNVHLAVGIVARSSRGVVADALLAVDADVERGQRLHVALATLVDTLGDPVRPLVRVLVDPASSPSQRVAQLDVVGIDARLERRRAAEIDARRVPVRLLFPLVLAVLPAFGLLTVVPIVAGSLRSVTG